MLVASCSALLKKNDDDGGADAAVVAEVVDAAPAPAPVAVVALAANQGDVARFPDETAIASVPATLQRAYNVREAPPAGVVVAGLPKGTAVTQLASRERYVLVLFDNAKAPGTKLMGWVHKDAFSAVIVDAGPPQCVVGEIALYGDPSFCGKLCSTDAECPAQQACKGSANKLLPSGKAGDGVTVCTVFHHDAGTVPPAPPSPPPVDAGKPPAVVDAGPPPPPPPVVDAGPGPAADVVAPGANGACPSNFLLVKKTGKCHRPCPGGITANQCKNKVAFCIKCDPDNKKVCSDSKEQCK